MKYKISLAALSLVAGAVCAEAGDRVLGLSEGGTGTASGPSAVPFTAAGATTDRTARDRAADAVSILDFGADKTGTANSRPAFVSDTAGVLRIPAGTFLLGSDYTPAAVDRRVIIDPTATISGGKLRLDALVPWQITPVFGLDVTSKTYGPQYAGYGNIFQRASYAKAAVADVPLVAQFGEGDAGVSGGRTWGGNHVGVVSAGGGIAIAEELNCSMLAAGDCYGLVIASAGNYQARAAAQIQANTAAAPWADGAVFNASTHPAIKSDGAIMKTMGAQSVAYGLNLSGWTFTSDEIVTPSFAVGSTPASISSKLRVDGSSTGNPTIAASGAGGTPAANSNINIQALGTGNVQSIVGGVVGLTVTADTTTPTAAVKVFASSTGNPTISAVGAGGSPASNSNINVQALGTGSVQFIANGIVGLAVKPGGVSQLAPLTVATLPTCNAGAGGSIAYVTDATAPTYNGTLSGGGSVRTLALCNGTGWTAH